MLLTEVLKWTVLLITDLLKVFQNAHPGWKSLLCCILFIGSFFPGFCQNLCLPTSVCLSWSTVHCGGETVKLEAQPPLQVRSRRAPRATAGLSLLRQGLAFALIILTSEWLGLPLRLYHWLMRFLNWEGEICELLGRPHSHWFYESKIYWVISFPFSSPKGPGMCPVW